MSITLRPFPKYCFCTMSEYTHTNYGNSLLSSINTTRSRITNLSRRLRSLHPKSRSHSQASKRCRLELKKLAKQTERNRIMKKRSQQLLWFREHLLHQAQLSPVSTTNTHSQSLTIPQPLTSQELRTLVVKKWFTRHDREIQELLAAQRGRPQPSGRLTTLLDIRSTEAALLRGAGLPVPDITSPEHVSRIVCWPGPPDPPPHIPDTHIRANDLPPPPTDPSASTGPTHNTTTTKRRHSSIPKPSQILRNLTGRKPRTQHSARDRARQRASDAHARRTTRLAALRPPPCP